jgi:Ca-activated chloride channel family protein
MIIPFAPDKTGAGVETPVSLNISGDIVDNFANVTYGLEFDNTASGTDSTFIYRFIRPQSMYLTNVSGKMGDEVFWGRVERIEQAQHEFNQSVSQNKTAILVSAVGDEYQFDLNVKAGAVLTMKIYLQGYLTRKLGIYSLDLYQVATSFITDLSISIDIKSTFSSVILSKFTGLAGYSRTPLTDGKRLTYANSEFSSIDFGISYTLSTLISGGKLISHNNGTDDFFAYLLAPEITTFAEAERREYIFVIDRSGSMGGTKMTQAKAAFISMMETLQSGDLFNVISFDDQIESVWTEPHAADTNSITTASNWVNGLDARGSTDINGALLTALDMFQATGTVKIIAFLSDGQPSTGIPGNDNILGNVLPKTEGISIYSISFGSATNEGLMANLAYKTAGQFTVILENQDAVQQMEAFYANFELPIALGVAMALVNTTDVYPNPETLTGALFNGSETLITGRFDHTMEIETTIKLSTGNQVYTNTVTQSGNNPQVEQIWAYNLINQLLKLLIINPQNAAYTKQLLDIALTYGIVVPGYTAMIIVVEQVDVPVETTTTTDTGTGSSTSTYPQPPVSTAISSVTTQISTARTDVSTQVDDVTNAGTQQTETKAADSPGFSWIVGFLSIFCVGLLSRRRVT